MKRKIKIDFLLLMLLLIVPLVSFSQEDGTANRSIDDLEPPPTPIDDFLIYFMIITIVGVGVYFFRKNNKLETK